MKCLHESKNCNKINKTMKQNTESNRICDKNCSTLVVRRQDLPAFHPDKCRNILAMALEPDNATRKVNEMNYHFLFRINKISAI